jgi:predicted RNA-binding protein with PUA-like domain
MKADPALAGMAMFRQFRLSVSPVTPDEWAVIRAKGGL